MKFRNWLTQVWDNIVSDYVEIGPLTEYEVARLFRDKCHPHMPWITLDSRERTLNCGLFDQGIPMRIRFIIEVMVEKTTYAVPLEIVLQHSFSGAGGAYILSESCIFLQTESPDRFSAPICLPRATAAYVLKAAQAQCNQKGILTELILYRSAI